MPSLSLYRKAGAYFPNLFRIKMDEYKKIERLLLTDKLKESIDQLLNLLLRSDRNNEEIKKTIITNSAFLHRSNYAFNQGLLSWKKYNAAKTKIIFNLLNILDDLKFNQPHYSIG